MKIILFLPCEVNDFSTIYWNIFLFPLNSFGVFAKINWLHLWRSISAVSSVLDGALWWIEILNYNIYIYILKYIHTFIVSAYYVLFMKILPTPRSWIYYHVSSSKSFIVLPFTFRPTVHLGQIFVCVWYEVRIQLT